MKQNSKKNYVITSLALYFTYFIHGIGASILGQYKPQFAKVWGATVGSDGTVDVSMVVSVIAALGLGRLISLPFSGPISDKFGRKLSGMIGVICYVIFFFGIAFSPSMGIAYAFAIVGGIANSFLDTCVSPTCMEIYVNNPSIANLFTKFFHVYQSVPAAVLYRNGSGSKYVLPYHLSGGRNCDPDRWSSDPVTSVPGKRKEER